MPSWPFAFEPQQATEPSSRMRASAPRVVLDAGEALDPDEVVSVVDGYDVVLIS